MKIEEMLMVDGEVSIVSIEVEKDALVVSDGRKTFRLTLTQPLRHKLIKKLAEEL